MTPKASKHGRATGKSFKGVFAYLLHDKRLEGESVRTTNDRLDWIEFNHVMTDDPELAWRIMAATARQQDEMKRRAGGSVAGNKSDQVVFHYSLAWHPDEKGKLSRSEMLRAANESLRALGASDHQSAVIAHNDTDHAHVHVVVNRVSLENGKLLDLWNYQKKLSKWAMAYEQSRGKVYCEQRVENWKRRDRGETVNAEKDMSWHHKDQSHAANDDDIAAMWKEQKRKDADLSAFGAQMHSRHRAEWKAYSADYHDTKAQILDREKGRTAFKRAREDVKAQFKPLRSELSRKQWAESKKFERKETRIAGKMRNAMDAVTHARRLDPDSSRGFMSMAFNFLISKKARGDALDKLHRAQWRHLKAAEKAQIDVAIHKLKMEQQTALAAFRQSFASRRQSLKDEQDAQRTALQRRWRERKMERQRVSKISKEMEGMRQETREAHRGKARADFNRGQRGNRKGRRSRKRKPD